MHLAINGPEHRHDIMRPAGEAANEPAIKSVPVLFGLAGKQPDIPLEF